MVGELKIIRKVIIYGELKIIKNTSEAVKAKFESAGDIKDNSMVVSNAF